MMRRRYKGMSVRIANEWTATGALLALALVVLLALVKGCGGA